MEQYLAAIRAYKKATTLSGVSNQDKFEEAYECAEGVRLRFERARAEMKKHMEEHCC